jgi:hypothetical protein
MMTPVNLKKVSLFLHPCAIEKLISVDSIAGAMQQLKTGGAPQSTRKKRVVEESSDDDSNTDGDVGEETDGSETDTDTDEDA